jgi:2-dehydropantoate 2-reductase
MKVCIFGVGAIGGHLGAKLCAAKKTEVYAVARGAQLDAIRKSGLTLKSGSEEFHGRPEVATDDPGTLPRQDVVIVTLKAHALPSVAAAVEQLLAPTGIAVFPLNGLTWWWRYGDKARQGPLPLLDPQHELWNRLRERALGCVAYSPNYVISPAVVWNIGMSRWVIGEPSGENTQRVQTVVERLNASGLRAEVSRDIRGEIWRKFSSNVWSNPLGAITRLNQGQVTASPDVKQVAAGLMRETLEISAAMGWDLRSEIDVEKQLSSRPAGPPAAATGPVIPPSMLQDVLAGRSLEVEAHLGQLQAFAREYRVGTPTLDVVLPLLRGLDQSIRQAAAR